MKVWLGVIVLLLLTGGGCRPGSDAVAEPDDAAADDRSPALVWLPQPGEPAPKWTAAIEGSACELACADVYACLLAVEHEPAAAAMIELGCLDACVRAPNGFAACERPGSIGADACPGYLECVRAAWPTGERAPTQIESLPSDGCGLACEAYARCAGASVEDAERCGKLCRDELDEQWERFAGECALLDSCSAIQSCVDTIPGAKG